MRKGSGYRWFRALLGRFRGTFVQVLTAGLVLNLIALSTPLFTILIYDRVIAVGSLETLPMLVVGAVVAIAFEWKLRSIRSEGLSWLAGRLDNVVSNRIFAHLIGLSPALIEKASIAAQIARIKTFESVRDFFSGSVFLSLIEAPFVVVAIVAMAWISGSLVMVPLAVVLAYAALFFIIRQQVKTSIRIAAKSSSLRQQFTIETFEKMEGIRAHGLSSRWQDKFRHLSGREMMAHFHLGWLGMVAETMANALTICAAVATIGFGAHLVWAGQMTAGALVASMMLVWRILTPFYSLCTMIPRLEQLRNSIDQVNVLMDIETEAEEARAFSRLPRIKGSVSFHHVSFAYSDEMDAVFSDLSFEARVGDLVAITGSNGSGKASILKLIQSLHRASSGTIRIDGFDIRQIDAPDLRRQIAYVPKVAHFFHGSVMENLRFANPLATEEEMYAALEMADALEDIRHLPQGLHTVIGLHRGVKLTSTLATKLSLARAYLHPAPMLLIDELPNSLLSGKVGENLKRYLARAKGKRTVIFCVYRDDFLKLADTVVWLRGTETPMTGERDVMLPLLTTYALQPLTARAVA
jgi:ABC-type bacteriocin/lantibiotic exporter with double-glycine peptidase domain